MKVGDVISRQSAIPDSIQAKVDGTPFMEYRFGPVNTRSNLPFGWKRFIAPGQAVHVEHHTPPEDNPDPRDEGAAAEEGSGGRPGLTAPANKAISESPFRAYDGARSLPDLSSLAGDAGRGAVMNELDMILDIPVQITVELGRTKLTIRTCCNWRTLSGRTRRNGRRTDGCSGQWHPDRTGRSRRRRLKNSASD